MQFFFRYGKEGKTVIHLTKLAKIIQNIFENFNLHPMDLNKHKMNSKRLGILSF